MKNKILNLFLLAVLSLVLFSCTKDENQVVFKDGTAPALRANLVDSIPLLKVNKDLPGVSFSWTNPNYTLNTGTSSQNVNYVLQMKLQGGGPWINTAITTSNITNSLTQGALNDFLWKSNAEGGLNIPFDSLAKIEVRIMSYLGALTAANATSLLSNVLVFKVRPYSVIPDLWITGNGTPSDWTNSPPDNQKFSYDLATKKFKIAMNFAPGVYYKFLEKKGFWQPQWGGAARTGGNLSVNDGSGSDPDAIETPAVAGVYILTVDLTAKTLVVSQ